MLRLKNIYEKLGILKEHVSNQLLGKFEKSTDIKALQETRKKKGNVFHDVVAYLYVREQRGSYISIFQKCKYWFVTSNYDLLLFNKEHASSGITEITMPDSLACMLWLKNPIKFSSRVRKTGLKELMATTLNNEIPSKELICEFESAISSLDDVSNEDYQILLESVAYQSVKNITEFNDIVNQDKNIAKQHAISIVEKEKSRKINHYKQIQSVTSEKSELERFNNELKNKIAIIEKDNKQNKTELEKLTTQIIQVKRRNRAICFFFIGIICLGIVVYKYNSIISWIVGMGGLWAFISCIINVIRCIK